MRFDNLNESEAAKIQPVDAAIFDIKYIVQSISSASRAGVREVVESTICLQFFHHPNQAQYAQMQVAHGELSI
jgi:hypothetical protein